MMANLFNGAFSFIHWSVPHILQIFTTAISTYITTRMIIKVSRFRADKIFNNFLGTKKGVLNSLGFAVFSVLLSLGYILLFWDYYIFVWDLFQFVPPESLVGNPELIESFIADYTFTHPSVFNILLAAIYSIFVLIVSVRLSYTAFVIADSNSSLIESIKKSWSITKGNFWRILFFPLSFILWIIPGIFTFGLVMIYVGPYMTIANACLYNNLLKEHGEDFDDGIKRKVVDTITDDKALDIDKDIFDKSDPFDNYYK